MRRRGLGQPRRCDVAPGTSCAAPQWMQTVNAPGDIGVATIAPQAKQSNLVIREVGPGIVASRWRGPQSGIRGPDRIRDSIPPPSHGGKTQAAVASTRD